jgi:TRAP-type C4-dicarboxylate transport system substrate-binding protein
MPPPVRLHGGDSRIPSSLDQIMTCSALVRRPWLPRVAAALVVTLGGLVPSHADAQITIKMATLVPDNSSWALILKQMAAEWAKLSGDRVKVRLYFGGTRGDDPNVVADMRTGALNAAVMTSVGVAEIDKSVYALGVPMAFDSYDEVYAVLDKMRPKLEASMESKGFVVLNWVDAGWVRFFTKKPVATPDDLKKLVLFQWQGDPKSQALWQAAGFNPRAGASSELLTGLKTGLYEACSISPQVAALLRYYEDAPYMTDLNWALLLGATVVTRDTWNKIPADLRPALLKSAQDAGAKLREDIKKNGESAIAAMQKAGAKVVPVPSKDAWIKIAQSMYPKIKAEYVPADAVDEALRYRDEYRKQHPPKK